MRIYLIVLVIILLFGFSLLVFVQFCFFMCMVNKQYDINVYNLVVQLYLVVLECWFIDVEVLGKIVDCYCYLNMMEDVVCYYVQVVC